MTKPAYAQVKTSQRFELGWNRLQTFIEIFVTIVVVAGLAGAFGSGPLSAATTTVPGRSIDIAYDRVQRRTVQSDVTITFKGALPRNQLAVELPTTFQREMDIVSTSPRSSEMRVSSRGVVYLFTTGDSDKGEITLSMKPKKPGFFVSQFFVDSSAVTLRQLVWP